MRGKVEQWRDEKGFGFIVPDDGSERVFFHISTVKTQSRRPKVGDVVIYDTIRDSQNRLKARVVALEVFGGNSEPQENRKGRIIEPQQKNRFDYLLAALLLLSLGAFSFVFYKSKSIEEAAPSAIFAAAAIILLNRKRRPKDKTFICSRCKEVVEHDARSIKAWNNGFLKLYCGKCHQQWLLDNPSRVTSDNLRRAGGCLGIFIMIVFIPALFGIGLISWLS